LSGINTRDFAGADINKVKAMIETGNVEWDVVQLSRSTVKNLMKKGDYFEKIDYDLVDMRTSIRRSPRSPRWRSC
jgi:putative spermidine/putrescine transport system substrate-binding protein